MNDLIKKFISLNRIFSIILNHLFLIFKWPVLLPLKNNLAAFDPKKISTPDFLEKVFVIQSIL